MWHIELLGALALRFEPARDVLIFKRNDAAVVSRAASSRGGSSVMAAKE